MAKTKKKLSIVALIIAVLLLLSMTLVACHPDKEKPNNNNYTHSDYFNNNYAIGGTVRLGNTTQATGNFRFLSVGTSSVNAADQDIVQLTSGYSTMEVNRNGEYVWNHTVVKSHSDEEIEHDDGSLTYKVTIEINPGLLFSDGTTELKAANFLVGILAFGTAVSQEGLGSSTTGQGYVGYSQYHAYIGDGSPVGATKYFSGLHLIDDYKFSVEIDSNNYPYYYATTLAAISPYNLALVLGEGVTVKDDGQGAYLDGNWFAQSNGNYVHANHLKNVKFDYTTYPYSGPYYVESWNESTSTATLKINRYFAGNFEGQKPHIETVTYAYLAQETSLQSLTSGLVDVLAGITGAADTNAALALLYAQNGKFSESHYDRAGYGKVQFDCDFGPTMFASVRQAIAYLVNRNEFAQTFTGGFGSVVNGPYCNSFDAYNALEDEIDSKLNSYDFSVENARNALINDGWIYNADGTSYTGGIRYKKLTAEQAKNEANIAYQSAGEGYAGTYKTVKVGDDYYMPCFVNWFGTSGNAVTELLNTMLVQGSNLASIGMGVSLTTGDFTVLQANIYRDGDGYSGTPTYGMYNLATGWNSAIYDYSYNWSLDPAYFEFSVNKLYDEYDLAFPYYKDAQGNWATDMEGTHTKLSFDEAYAQSGGKLGMDYISYAMVYDVDPGDTEEYNKWWLQYQIRFNELLPDIPLYSNIYYDLYNSNILNFGTSPFYGASQALVYCAWAPAQNA